jgi:GNAT superfamily N-acetyltransferase
VSQGFADDLKVLKLAGPPFRSFDCGREEQNEFLHRHAWHDQQESVSTTYLFSVDGLPAAYASVCMDALPLARAERSPLIRFANIGAVKLAQLGVHRPFQGQGVGARAIGFVVHLARRASKRIACRYLTLDAQPDLVEWYGRLGFVPNQRRQEERMREAVRHGRDPSVIAVSMRYDLREP